MTIEELEIKIREALVAEDGDMYAIFVQFKNEGGAQRAAYDLCSKIALEHRDDEDETLYNAILDVSDCVWGWCHPHYQIWDTTLKD